MPGCVPYRPTGPGASNAPNLAESFRAGVRQSLMTTLKHRNLPDAEIEQAAKEICYRAADLSYLLATRTETLAKYSKELRREQQPP